MKNSMSIRPRRAPRETPFLQTQIVLIVLNVMVFAGVGLGYAKHHSSSSMKRTAIVKTVNGHR